MRHIIHAYHGSGSDETTRMSRDVPEPDAGYLRDTVIPLLRPLSPEDYAYGPAAILQSAAPYSYVLDGEMIYWCVEWNPGLLVLRFSPDGSLAWAAMKSPNPEFGGREAADEEWEAYDEDAEDPQYNLVFEAWDAQFEQDREGWEIATSAETAAFQRALEPVNRLVEALETEWASGKDEWLSRCKSSPLWRGDWISG